jgi:predicted aspartyl protease
MPTYNTDQFDPPAPVASVTLRHLETGAALFDVPMLIDTGADVTLLPRDVVEKIGVIPVPEKVCEVQGFDGSVQFAEMVQLELVFLGKKFRGQFLVTDQPQGILGRNILNAVALLLDGPHINWDEYKRR